MYYQTFFSNNTDNENELFETIITQDFQNFNTQTEQFFYHQQQSQFNIPNPNYFSDQINQKIPKRSPIKFNAIKDDSTNSTLIITAQELFKKSEIKGIKNINIMKNVKQAYLSTSRGTKRQTTELNINIKTLTKNILMESVLLREFNKQQIQKVYHYAQAKANFLTTQQLFGVEKTVQVQDHIKCDQRNTQSERIINVKVKNDSNRIRKKCFEQYSSSSFIKSIFKAEKMAIKNKLTIIKFMENIRESPLFPQDLKKWKTRE